jgi:GABA permease
MESPFRSEAAAFRFLLITLAAFAVIVLAAWIDTTFGFVVWIVVSAAAVWYYLRQRGSAPEQEHVEHVGGAEEQRVLVVANEAIGAEELMSAISTRALSKETRFLVVCPALTSRLDAWTSDEDAARAEAQERLDEMLTRLVAVGISARGEVGDTDPLVAIADAVHTFHPDEIVIATHPPGRSKWHEAGVVQSANARFDVPVTHVVVGDEAAG